MWLLVIGGLAICGLIRALPPVGAQTGYMVRDTPVQRPLPTTSALLVDDTFYATQGIALNDRLLPVEGDVDFQRTDLAPGVSLDDNGWLVGAPVRPGTYSNPVKLCRGHECVQERVTLVVLRNVPWEPDELTFPGKKGVALDGEIAVNGGPKGILPTYTVTDDRALPDGVSIGPDGHVGGVPKRSGVSEVPVRICVAGNCAGVVVTLIVV